MANKALVVGINDYPGCPLTGCVGDARAMEKVLARHDDGSKNFDVILRPNIRKKGELRKLIRELFNTGEGEIALFYFSGHGCVAGHDGYIVTPDYEEGDEGISLAEILKEANEADGKYRFYSHLSGNGEMGLGLRDRVSRLRGRSSRSIPRRCGSPLPSV